MTNAELREFCMQMIGKFKLLSDIQKEMQYETIDAKFTEWELKRLIFALNVLREEVRKYVDTADTPQTDCYMCKWLGEVDVCGRCRNRNLFCEAEPQPRCPKCGKRGYIRSLESMGVKLKVFDEYRWKCTNCNKYFKEEPNSSEKPNSSKERSSE